jgi:hypothetical protein
MLESIHAEKLLELAQKRFSEEIYDAEVRILSDSARSQFPEVSEEEGALPLVRSEFLRWMVADEEVRQFVDPRGIRVWRAKVSGALSLSDCTIPFPLDFRGCEFDGCFSLVASETRQISLQGCSLAKGISADRLVAHGALIMRWVRSFGEIRLHGATIEGNLEVSASRLETSGSAITLDQATVLGDVIFKFRREDSGSVTPFRSSGSIHLNGSSIRGDVLFAGAIIKLRRTNTEASALYLDRAKIGGSLDLSQKFVANRAIRAVDANIGSYAGFRSVRLCGRGAGVNLNRAQVSGSVFLDMAFKVSGNINLANARIASDLSFNGARVGQIVCEGCKIGGDLIWTNVRNAPFSKRFLNLSGANVQAIMDDEKSWPEMGNLLLEGFTYRNIELFPPQDVHKISSVSMPPRLLFDSKKRIEWLKRQSIGDQMRPQSWVQLSACAQGMGEDEAAHHVLYAYECFKADSTSPGVRFLARWFAKAFAALREKPIRILIPVFGCLMLASLLFSHAARMHAIAPTSASAYQAWTHERLADQAYPQFNALVYGMEDVLPILKLGQSDNWAPDPHYSPQNWFPKHPGLDWTAWFSSYEFLSSLRVTLNVLGWGFGIVLGIALTTRFKP